MPSTLTAPAPTNGSLATLIEDERAVAVVAETYAPQPRPWAHLGTPDPMRRAAVALFEALRGAGRSVSRARLLTAYIYGVSPATVEAWRRRYAD